MKSQKTPEADTTQQIDLYAKFTELSHFGIISHPTDFSGIPLQYTVVDSLAAPVPYANLVSELRGAKTILRTNSQGVALLAFDSVAIMRQPQIYGVKGQAVYEVQIDFQFSGTPGEAVEVADISSLHPYPVGQDLVLYDAIARDSLDRIAALIADERQFIHDLIQLAPIPWGAAVMHIGNTYTTTQTRYHWQNREYDIFVYPIKSIATDVVFVNVHEWVEQTLLEHIQFEGTAYRWVTDGIAEWATWAFYAQLPDSARQNIGLPREKVIPALEKLIGYLEEEGQRSYSLVDWEVLETKENETLPPLQLSAEAIRYKVAASFWMEVAQYDATIIPTYLSQLAQLDTVSTEVLQSELQALLPLKLQLVLQEYQVTQAVDTYQNYLVTLQQ